VADEVNYLRLDVAELPEGLYFLSITNKDKVRITRKFILSQ